MFSYTCYAQSGYSTDSKTIFGGIFDLDNITKGFITVEVQLKADFYNDKLTSVKVVSYRYYDGTIWENARSLFDGNNWVEINQKAAPISYLYKVIRSKNEISDDIKRVFKFANENFTLSIMLSSNRNFIMFM